MYVIQLINQSGLPVILSFSDTNLSNHGNNICKKKKGGMSYFLFMVFCLNKLSAIFIPIFYFISILYTCVLQSFSKYLLLNVQRPVNTSSCKCLVFSYHYLLLTNTLKQYSFSYLNVIMLLSQKMLFNRKLCPQNNNISNNS